MSAPILLVTGGTGYVGSHFAAYAYVGESVAEAARYYRNNGTAV